MKEIIQHILIVTINKYLKYTCKAIFYFVALGALITWPAVGLTSDSPPNLNQRTPLEVGTLGVGESATHTIPVEGGSTIFGIQWEKGTLIVTLVSPEGDTIDPAFAQNNPDVAVYQAESNIATYYILDIAPGQWQLKVTGGTDIPSEGTNYVFFASLNSSLTLTALTDRNWYKPGEQMVLSATLSEVPLNATMTANITYINETTETVTLNSTGEGTYEGVYTVLNIPGYAQVSLSVQGEKADGIPFARSEKWLIQISSDSAALNGSYSDSAAPNPEYSHLYESLNVTVGIDSNITGKIGLSADLVNSDGEKIAHATVTKDVLSETDMLTLNFSGEDIFDSQQNGPYRLTHLLLVDQREGFVPVDQNNDAYTTSPYNYRSFAPKPNYPTVDSGGPYSVDEGSTVTLTASGTDPEGDKIDFAWDLNEDGTWDAGGQSVTFSAEDIDGPGTRNIIVQVVDRNGYPALTQTTLDVLNVDPVVELGEDVTIKALETFTSTGSFTDPGTDTWTATVNYGDDSDVEELTLSSDSFSLDHTYPQSGVYLVTVTVTDDDGGQGSNTLVVTVENTPPTALCQNVEVNANSSCTGEANVNNGSSDEDGDDISFEQTPSGPYPLGTTEVTLKVTDDQGAFSTCQAVVSVVDTTAPFLSCPANITVECAEIGGTSGTNSTIGQFLAGVTATDACDADLPITHDAPEFFERGATKVVAFNSADNSGNTSECTASVTVTDTTAPDITATLILIGESDDDEGLFRVEFSATDMCDADPDIKAKIACNGNKKTVTYGQMVEIEIDDDECEIEEDDGKLEVEGSSVELVVEAGDAYGNVDKRRFSPLFQGDDEEDEDD